MSAQTYDILVIGGGIHGAAIARDAAGRGLKVMLAEKDDYANAASSASSKLIHGGLRYLERLDLKLVRESLTERAELLRTAPHLVAPLTFLLPLFDWQKRSALFVHAGLALYDLLSFGDGLPQSGRLSEEECTRLPRLRQDHLRAVLHYPDCQADDARLTLSVALDARVRGADIANSRAVTALIARDNGFTASLEERGTARNVDARFVVNTAGPFVAEVDAMAEAAPPQDLRLVRGSHIVLPMPEPACPYAFTLQDEGERIVFVMPWLQERFLIVGTTDVPQEDDPGTAECSPEETAYLLDAYNRYFTSPDGKATKDDIVYTWSGLRALCGKADETASRINRDVTLETASQGNGGLLTLIGGKLTTHRATAEQALDRLKLLGLTTGPAWTKGVTLHGGGKSREAFLSDANSGPETIAAATRTRWALTYGDGMDELFGCVRTNAAAAGEIAPGVPRAELDYAVEKEDARNANDFLLRRTKLHLLLDEDGRGRIADWFAKHG